MNELTILHWPSLVIIVPDKITEAVFVIIVPDKITETVFVIVVPLLYTLFCIDLSAFLAPLFSFWNLSGFLLKYTIVATTTKATTTQAATIPMMGPMFLCDLAT